MLDTLSGAPVASTGAAEGEDAIAVVLVGSVDIPVSVVAAAVAGIVVEVTCDTVW
jgi:hypothetical protein